MSEEVPYVFICFSSSDEAVAREVVQTLEAHDLSCWISLRDVPPGHNYQESIIKALEGAKGLIFLFSEFSSASGEIKKELSVAGSLNVPVFPLRLLPITPTGALRYELATRQWIDIFPDREQGLRKLVEAIRKALSPASATEHHKAEARPIAFAPGIGDGGRARAPIVAPGSQEFEAIRALLARHIGPIAKIIVQKATTEARTPDDFCERLAAHVSSAADRAAFLRDARSRLASKS